MTAILAKYADQTNRSTFFSQNEDLSLSRSASCISSQDLSIEQRLTRIDDLSRRIKDTVMAPVRPAETEPADTTETASPVKEKPSLPPTLPENDASRQRLFNWLTNLKLDSCYRDLSEAGYDDLDQMVSQMNSSLPINEDFLVRIGIRKPGYRLRLMAALEMESGEGRKSRRRPDSLGKSPDSQAVSTTFAYKSLQDWLHDLGLGELAPLLVSQGFEDLELLLVQMNSAHPITAAVLEQAGVTERHSQLLVDTLQRDSVGVEQYHRYLPVTVGLEMEREGRHVTCQSCAFM